MTDEQPDNDYQKLRDEFQTQFTTLKESFNTTLSELKAQNEELKKHNEELQRALIRSAVTPEPSKEPELSDDDKYDQMIEKLAKLTLSKM